MTREEFATQCERGALQAAELPVTSAILRWTAEQLKRSEPPWWKSVAKAWEKRLFSSWTEPWRLYLAALHFEALNDADSVLVPYFPSCGGTAEADPSAAVGRFLASPPTSFFENLRDKPMRHFRGELAALWTSPAMLFFQRRRLPYYVVEIGAGAGLNLAADLYNPQKAFRSDLVDARVGLDALPLVVEDITQRRWLTACQFTDDSRAIVLLDAAVEKLIAANREDASFVQLAPCPPQKSTAFIAKNVPPEEDLGLLVFNVGVTGVLPDPAYANFAKNMHNVLSAWGDRGLWVEMETVRGEKFSGTLQLRVHRAAEGRLRSMVMLSIDVASGAVAYADAAADFLSVLPVKK